MSSVFQTMNGHVTSMAHWKLPEIQLGSRLWSFAQRFRASSHSTVSSLWWKRFYDFYLISKNHSLAIFLSVSCFWSDFCFDAGNSLPCWCPWMLMIQCWISLSARCSRQQSPSDGRQHSLWVSGVILAALGIKRHLYFFRVWFKPFESLPCVL